MSLFVTFEGTEGSGKSTQARLLGDFLTALGHSVVVTREPGGTELGEAIRAILLNSPTPICAEAEAYLMTGARAEHVRRVILPALARDVIVLSDRYYDSTLAYQGGGRGLSDNELRRMQSLAIDGCHPDVTFLLDLPVTLGLARRTRDANVNRIDRESQEFHERVSHWYRHEAAANRDRWVIVDATQRPDVVHTVIRDVVLEFLGARRAIGQESSSR